MTEALVVPDPREVNVPAGWWEHQALALVQACGSWDELDEYEAQLLAMASLIEGMGGDALEFQKALRVVECRRGQLLGPHVKAGRPSKFSTRGELDPNESEGAKNRYRQIARYWDAVVYPYLLKTTDRWKVTQAHILRLVQREETHEALIDTTLPTTHFPVIYADPPWRYEHVKTESRAVENQYPTMDLPAICALPVSSFATDDAVLFLWATSPKLHESMQVIDSWGFTYRTCMVWVKDKIGMGYYARQRHELLLIAAKGKLPVPLPAHRPDSVVTAPRTEHSEKPVVFYELIERMYPGLPKIELFCRLPREGWAVWGNQAA